MRERACVFGEFCSYHGFVHGAEAEELREKLEKFVGASTNGGRRQVQRILDEVDARDSLAYVEARNRDTEEKAELSAREARGAGEGVGADRDAVLRELANHIGRHEDCWHCVRIDAAAGAFRIPYWDWQAKAKRALAELSAPVNAGDPK
jgi:hypothetical protein